MLNKKASLCLIFFRQFVAVVVVAVVFQCFGFVGVVLMHFC